MAKVCACCFLMVDLDAESAFVTYQSPNRVKWYSCVQLADIKHTTSIFFPFPTKQFSSLPQGSAFHLCACVRACVYACVRVRVFPYLCVEGCTSASCIAFPFPKSSSLKRI